MSSIVTNAYSVNNGLALGLALNLPSRRIDASVRSSLAREDIKSECDLDTARRRGTCWIKWKAWGPFGHQTTWWPDVDYRRIGLSLFFDTRRTYSEIAVSPLYWKLAFRKGAAPKGRRSHIWSSIGPLKVSSYYSESGR